MLRIIKFFLLQILLVSGSSCLGSRLYLPMDSVIKWSPLIIEGRVVKVTPSFMLDKTIYTSYIVRVLKLFKGKIEREYFEIRMVGGTVGNLSMNVASCGTTHIPGEGVAAIFFLAQPKKFDSLNQISPSGDTLAKNYLIDPYYDASDIGSGIKNIERDLYRHIESVTGQKRIILRSEVMPTIQNDDWLPMRSKRRDCTKAVAFLSFAHSEAAYGQKKWDLFVDLTAYPLYSDLKSLQFAIRYNEKAFGTYVVKNKRVEFNNQKLYRMWRKEELNPTLINGAYKTKIEDIDSTSILISLELKDTSLGIYQIAKELVAFLEFDMKSTADSNIVFAFLPDYARGRYFNYQIGEISNFEGVFCSKNSYTRSTVNLPPAIYSFSPDTIECNKNTLTIKGHNFSNKELNVEFQTGNNLYCPIYPIQFISHDDSTIVIAVNCAIGMNGRTCGFLRHGETNFRLSTRLGGFSYPSPKKLFIK